MNNFLDMNETELYENIRDWPRQMCAHFIAKAEYEIEETRKLQDQARQSIDHIAKAEPDSSLARQAARLTAEFEECIRTYEDIINEIRRCIRTMENRMQKIEGPECKPQ